MSGKTMFLSNLVMSLKFFLKDKLDRLEICNGRILKTHFLLKQMKSGPRLYKICKL